MSLMNGILQRKAVDVRHGTDARRHILEGAKILAQSVGVTYGPHGRTVILDRMAGLLATKDGVTVAREVELDHPIQNLGCQILKTACIKVNSDAGDGTTSTAIIAAALLEEGHKLVVSGFDPMQVARGIQAAAERAIEVIRSMGVPVEDQEILKRVAMIASNGDEAVSDALAEACMAVGKDGTITIEDGRSVGIELIYKEGMEIDRGVAATAFLGTSATERVMEGPLVAVIGASLKTVEDVQSVMEVASQWPQNHLLLFCEDISGDALKMMVMNDQQGVMHCVAVPAPGFHNRKKDYLRDLAALAGADYIDPSIGGTHQEWDPTWFGGFRQATIKEKSSVLVAYDEASETIEARIEEIRAELNNSSSEYDRDRCKERLAKLSGGLCIMAVGGFTEAEMKERRARIEDALGAVQAALAEGIVPGAGTSYLIAGDDLLDEVPQDKGVAFAAGWKMTAKALQRPLRVLARNAGFDGPEIVENVRKARHESRFLSSVRWVGWDARTHEIRDLARDPSIIDPVPVAVTVVRSAASVASTLLTIETSITPAR